MSTSKPKAVVLLSGGLDSATTAALAAERGFAVHALTFQYGQRHKIEVEASIRVAKALGVAKQVFQTIDLRVFGGSALTDTIDVPKALDPSAVEVSTGSSGIPVTYVPARNTIFLSFALGYAEVLDAADIFVGVNAVDYSGYPDCRPEFLSAFEQLAKLATKSGVEGTTFTIHAPLIQMTKAQIILEGTRLGVDFGLTHSCYDPSNDGIACGRCDSCIFRRRGFTDAGLVDPLPYA